MRITIAGLCLLMFSALVWAGTWRDDFEDGDLDGWEGFINNGKMEEKRGQLIITDVDFRVVSLAFFNNGQALEDFTLTIDSKIAKDGGNAYLWVLFRCNEDVSISAYYQDALHALHLLSIFDGRAGWIWNIGRVDVPFAFRIGEWYHLKLEMKQNRVTLWIDGKLMAQADWRNQPILPKKGKIGFGGGSGEFHFDNLVITGDQVPDGGPGGQGVNAKGKLTTTWGQLKAH